MRQVYETSLDTCLRSSNVISFAVAKVSSAGAISLGPQWLGMLQVGIL